MRAKCFIGLPVVQKLIMGFKIDITGNIDNLFKERTRKIVEQIEDELNAFGQGTVNDAKRLAPVDEGHLRNSITFSPTSKGNMVEVEIIAATDYAAYIEFGTGKFAAKYVATLPKEWKEFAAKFKGPGGGSFDEFVMRLTRWVRLKGIAKGKDVDQAAYNIALYILRNGIKPHPFLYPSVEKNRIKLLINLKALQ